MTAFTIQDVKGFMNAMLRGTLFDSFLLKEAFIAQLVTYTIDGAVRMSEKSPGTEKQDTGYIPFPKVKNICFDMIKGKQTPAYFKFVFLLSPENKARTVASSGSGFKDEDILSLSYNLIYKNGTLIFTTGISYRSFTKDRTLEIEWDRLAEVFLRKNSVTASRI